MQNTVLNLSFLFFFLVFRILATTPTGSATLLLTGFTALHGCFLHTIGCINLLVRNADRILISFRIIQVILNRNCTKTVESVIHLRMCQHHPVPTSEELVCSIYEPQIHRADIPLCHFRHIVVLNPILGISEQLFRCVRVLKIRLLPNHAESADGLGIVFFSVISAV